MDPIEALKKLLSESVGADQTNKIVESLNAYKEKLEGGVKALVAEGVKAEKIKLEADYLQKLEEAKAEADKSVKAELTVYEKQLAARVKTVLEQAVDAHGDRLARIEEAASAKRGSALLSEVEALVSKAKAEITEKTQVKPEDLKKLQEENKQLKESLEAAKKETIQQKARANVAEGELKTVREALETSIAVTVTETETTKGKPAAEEHPDTTGKQQVTEDDKGGKPAGTFTPEMARMRKLAGLKPNK